MANIYCGIGKVPKDKKLGSMIECAEKGQISYWGLKKIDPKVIDAVKNKKTKPVTREKLYERHAELKVKKKKLEALIDNEKNKTKKVDHQKELKKITKQFDEIIDAIKKFEAQRKKEKTQKTTNKSRT